jgi:two-component sensor histidine kinase
MKLSTKIVLTATVSLVLLAAVVSIVSIRGVRRTAERYLEEYLSLGLDHYIQEYPKRLSDLLERNGLQEVDSFVDSYQQNALEGARLTLLGLGASIEVIDMDNRKVLVSPSSERPGGSGDDVLDTVRRHLERHEEEGTSDDGFAHLDRTSGNYYVYQLFDPWGWTVVSFAPDTFVRGEIRSVAVRTGLITVGTALLSAFILGLLLRQLFLRPVLAIAGAARTLPAGEMVSVPGIDRADELGTLARDISEAGRTIVESQRQLKETNRGLEKTVKERTAELSAALEQQKTLVREVHHRVKNNMVVIQALLSLQKGQARSAVIAEVISKIQRRIESMTLIHEQLYRIDGGSSNVDASDYLKTLVTRLDSSLATGERLFMIESDIESVPLTMEVAVPCGLIINELVSNAAKYAFSGRSRGTITVHFSRLEPGRLRLSVSDDGVGLEKPFGSSESGGIGSTIVITLTEQLGGEVETVPQPGLTVAVTFPDPSC